MTIPEQGDDARAPRTLPNGWQVEETSRSETDYLYREIVTDQIYYSPHVGPRPQVVVDVGANIGLFALYAATTWRPDCIVALEAIPDLREILRRNVHRNETPPTTVLVPDVAAGAASTKAEFVFYPDYSMMSGRWADPAEDFALVRHYVEQQVTDGDDCALMTHLDELIRPRFTAERRQVQIEPLSAICADAGLHGIDLLKIDVEGDELAVLDGLGDLEVRNVVVEVDARRTSVAAARAALESRGLAVSERSTPGYERLPLSILLAHPR